jgi:hypothetical protein
MALIKNLTLESGINLPTAYLKISEVNYKNYAYQASYVELIISVFKDQDARESGKVEVIKLVHRCSSTDFNVYFQLSVLSEEGKNVINQGYNWLLTLDTYSGATSVLDDKESD